MKQVTNEQAVALVTHLLHRLDKCNETYVYPGFHYVDLAKEAFGLSDADLNPTELERQLKEKAKWAGKGN